jgi:hypothetical protein
MTRDYWRKCSSCKKPIGFDEVYWVCNVSTCNRKRTGFFFCSVSCWEAHGPMMRHRESYAVEKRSPTLAEWQKEETGEAEAKPASPAVKVVEVERKSSAAPAKRRVVGVRSDSAADDDLDDDADLPRDILIVVSKLKKYIKARSGMNTSDGVMPGLSDHVRKICDQAIRNAGADGRKTVLDRDVPPVVKSR